MEDPAQAVWSRVLELQRLDHAKLVSQEVTDDPPHRLFQLPCRNTPSVTGRSAAMHQSLGDVVAIPPALLVGMGRTQLVPGLIVGQTGQEARRLTFAPRPPACGIV